MEILSCLKYVKMMRIKTKNPPLDQTGGPREEELERTGQLYYQRIIPPRQCKSLKGHTNLHHKSAEPNFSAFVMNQLKVDTLTPELLVGPTFELMKGSCKSLVELEYFLKEVYKTTTDQLDWNNPEGQQYPHDLRKPLPLILNSQGRRVYNLLITSKQTTMTVSKGRCLMPELYCNYTVTKDQAGQIMGMVESFSNSMDLLSIGNLLMMSTPGIESLLLQSFRLVINGIGNSNPMNPARTRGIYPGDPLDSVEVLSGDGILGSGDDSSDNGDGGDDGGVGAEAYSAPECHQLDG
ncbi:hypothetical protein Tco_0851030 [Tanacetum coccineum]